MAVDVTVGVTVSVAVGLTDAPIVAVDAGGVSGAGGDGRSVAVGWPGCGVGAAGGGVGDDGRGGVGDDAGGGVGDDGRSPGERVGVSRGPGPPGPGGEPTV